MKISLPLVLSLFLATACSHKSNKNDAIVPSASGTESEVPARYKSFTLAKTLEPLPGLKIYDYHHKKSGLEVFLVPQAGTKVVAYVTSYSVGSRYETRGHTGLAHLFEHMMFRGTESFPQPFMTLSSWGDRFNAYTSTDLTLYHELVPKELLSQVAKFESERMRHLLITVEGYNTERGAVVSERKMRTEDSPPGKLRWELNQFAFDVHPYKTPPIGLQADLDHATFEDALAFYRRFYAPNRAKISIVGDFTLPEVLEQLELNYGKFESQPWVEPKIPHEPIRKIYRRKVISAKVESVYLADSVMSKTYGQPNAEVDSLLCELLANSRTGFLSFELVEKGIARSVSAECGPDVDPGLSTVNVLGNPGVPLKVLESAYDKARHRFLAWLTKDRVEKAKLFFLAEQWASLRDPMNLSEQIARQATIAKDPLYSFTSLKKVQKLSLGDLVARYKTWNINHTRVILEPSKVEAPKGNK